MGRPTKITPEQMEPYFESLRVGNTQHDSAAVADVSDETIQRARRFAWFCVAEKKAQAEAVNRRVARIERAGEGGFLLSRKTTVNTKIGVETTEETYSKPEWTADAWLLERRHPQDWAKRDANEALNKMLNILLNGVHANPV